MCGDFMKMYRYASFIMLFAIFCIQIACGKVKKHIEIADALVKEEKLDEALSEYTKAIEADVNLAEAYYGRGSVYLKQERLEEAATDFRKAIDINPNYIDAHKKLAETFIKIGAPDDEFQKRFKAIQNDPDNALVYVELGVFYHKLEQDRDAI